MPHLTGILKQHWDDPDLALTSEQKKVLLETRANTMSAVMGLAQELDPLESSLAQQAMGGAPPVQLAPLVDTISLSFQDSHRQDTSSISNAVFVVG